MSKLTQVQLRFSRTWVNFLSKLTALVAVSSQIWGRDYGKQPCCVDLTRASGAKEGMTSHDLLNSWHHITWHRFHRSRMQIMAYRLASTLRYLYPRSKNKKRIINLIYSEKAWLGKNGASNYCPNLMNRVFNETPFPIIGIPIISIRLSYLYNGNPILVTRQHHTETA